MDRRALNRAVIPGTQVQFKRISSKSLFTSLSRSTELINISKSGICIAVSSQFNRGEIIIIKVQFPDGKKIKLRGHIRWQKADQNSPTYLMGIQFYPFGHTSTYNSLKALEYLRTLAGQSLEISEPPQAEA